jgi:hypothetical protein
MLTVSLISVQYYVQDNVQLNYVYKNTKFYISIGFS